MTPPGLAVYLRTSLKEGRTVAAGRNELTFAWYE